MLWPNKWNTLADILVNGIHPSSYYMFQINQKFETWRDVENQGAGLVDKVRVSPLRVVSTHQVKI